MTYINKKEKKFIREMFGRMNTDSLDSEQEKIFDSIWKKCLED